MRADFPVVLDACVLVEAAVSDLLLRLSEEPRLLLPKWTDLIWQEVHRTWVDKLGWPLNVANSRMNAAISAFPEAMIRGFEHVIPVCTNHPDDHHVLAAAIHDRVEIIVTFNVKDYPRTSVEPWGVTVAHPADYLKVLYDHDPAVVTSVLHTMANRTGRTMPELLARLGWYIAPFSQHVAALQSIDVPEMSPAKWRR